MAKQINAYITGNAARRLYEEPVRAPHREPERRLRRRPEAKPAKRRVDKLAVVLIIATFAVAFAACYGYLRLQFENTYLNKSVVALENEVVEMEKSNANEKQALDNAVDLDSIYDKATKELGMKSAKNNQVYTYNSKKSTQVRLHNK